MSEIIAPLQQFINALKQGDPETIVTMIGIFLVFCLAFLLDKLINGEDASNSFRRHNDDRR